MPLFNRKKEYELKKPNSMPSSPVKNSVVHVGKGTEVMSQTPPQYIMKETSNELVLQEFDEPFLLVTSLRTKSRLSKTMEDVLQDNVAVGFLVKYMENRHVGAYIKFWLDAESFHASARARLQTHSVMDGFTGGEGKKALKNHVKNVALNNSCHLSGSDGCLNQVNSKRGEISTSNVSETHSTRTTLGRLTNCDKQELIESSCQQKVRFYIGDPEPVPTLDADGDTALTERTNSYANDCSNGKNLSCTTQKCNNALFSHTRSSSTDSMLVHKLKKSIAEDAVKIFTQYIAKDALSPIGISDEMRNDITAKICQEDGHVDPSCFVSAQAYITEIIRRDHFPGYIVSDYHCKYQIDVLTSGKVNLEDILYNETALTFFMEFMEQEEKRNLLEFWLTTDNFRQHLTSQKGEYDALQAQDDAMVLYDKYFSLQATCPVGFSDAIRFEVEQNICREDGPLPDCFEKPLKIIFHYLQKSYLQPFLGSQLYFTYLSELLNSVRQEDEFSMTKRRTSSDASSEHGCSTMNTLLAMDSTQMSGTKKVIKNIHEQDMRIDVGTFNNPEALWKRRMAGKLSFGKVSKLGKFIPELEPEPDRKRNSESVLSKAMKRLVNKEEDKVKEDMAWQVAEMIINEVTTVTCPETSSQPRSCTSE